MMMLFVATLSAHGYQIEKPIEYKFVFENQDTLILNSRDIHSLDFINTEILKRNKELAIAVFYFDTGEQLVFKYNDSKLDEIRILDRNRSLHVPEETIDKLPNIHFHSISLIWDEHFKKAFDSKYFTIQFNVGKAQSFGKYYYVQLNFSDLRFDKATIWRQIDEHKKQWRALK